MLIKPVQPVSDRPPQPIWPRKNKTTPGFKEILEAEIRKGETDYAVNKRSKRV